ncbi:MAG: prepilin peptidase [Pseudomonadota bacterium]
MIENSLVLFFPFLMIYAALSDLFSMTISNKISLVLITGFMVFAFFIGMDWQTIAWHWAMFAIVLLVGFGLFALGVVGGGDAKLAASTALWFGWDHILEYIYLSSIVGAILTLLLIYFRAQTLPMSINRIEWVERIYNTESGVPYGIALGIGALMVYPGTLWMQYVFDAASKL